MAHSRNGEIVVETTSEEEGLIRIFDPFGRQIKNYDIPKNENRLIINLENQRAGILYFKYITKSNESTGKILIVSK